MSQKEYAAAIPDVDARGEKMPNVGVMFGASDPACWPMPIVGRDGQNQTAAKRTHDA